MRNIILLGFLFLLSLPLGYGQCNYEYYRSIKSNDLIGLDICSVQQTLDSAAHKLVQSFPQEFRADFRVYSTSFYFHTSEFVNGIPVKFQEAIDLAGNTTDYYLVFGREMDEKHLIKKYWIELHLPNANQFSCLDEVSNGFREEILSEVRYAMDINEANFANREKAGMQRLESIIPLITNCCSDPQDPDGTCSSCLSQESEQGDIPYETIVYNLRDKGFAFELVSIVEDEDNNLPALTGQSGINRGGGENIEAVVNFYDSLNVDLDNLVANLKSSYQNRLNLDFDKAVTFSVYKFKYPRDCGKFEQLWNAYENDNADFSLFVALININGQSAAICYHYKTNITNDIETRSSQAGVNETLEGLRELKGENPNVCGNLLLSYGNRFVYKIDIFFANIYLSEKDRAFWDKFYLEEDKITEEALKYASDEWTEYYAFEYDYLIRKGSDRRIAYVQARLHLCSEFIHGALDLCGITGLGPVCDPINATFYLLEGDRTNAVLSLASTVPLLGDGINASKIAGRVIKIESVRVPIGFTFNYVSKSKYVKFTGGVIKLKEVMKKLNYSNVFAGVTRYWNTAGVEIHHLIPSALFTKETGQLPIFIRMASNFGWHAGDPFFNGVIIPKRFPNNTDFIEGIVDVGGVFHGNHPKYTDWVTNALMTLDKGSSDEVLKQNYDFLQQTLLDHLENAYNQNLKINEYFRSLIREEEYFAL